MKKFSVNIKVDETMDIEAKNQEEAVEKFLEWFWESDLSDLIAVEEVGKK